MGGGLVKAGAKGLGSLVGKAGENTVKYGVTPGLVSGGAGTALEGTPLETPARVGGALLGAGVAGAIKGKAAGPTSADLKTEARQFYDQVGHVVVEPKSFAKVANDIAISTGKLGLHPKIHPKASAGLEELQKVIGTAPDFNEIDRLRQILGQAAKSADEGERFMAGKMIHQLDDWMDNLKPGDVISGDPRQAADTLIKARSLWNRARKAEIIENIKERAEKTVSTNYTHAGYITAVRRELRALSNRKDFKVRFRPDERQMINDIIHGGPVENIAKLFSRFAVRGAPSGAAALGLGFLSPPLAGAMMAAGEAGQFIANQTARGQVNRLEEMIRTGVAPPKLPPTIPPQLLPFYTMPGTAQSK
jgi:hypothetical protein